MEIPPRITVFGENFGAGNETGNVPTSTVQCQNFVILDKCRVFFQGVVFHHFP